MTRLSRFWAPVARRLPRIERLVVFASPATRSGEHAIRALGFDLREMSESTLEQLTGLRQRHQIDPLRAMLREGLRGWCAMMDGRVAGYAFLAVAADVPRRFGGVWLYPGEMAIVSLFVASKFRGRGLGGAFHVELVAMAAREAGSTTNIAWTADYNVASRRMLGRLGCTPIGTITRLIVWFRPLVSIYRGTPPTR